MFGESLSIIVAITWTITALVAESASKRIGPLQVNVARMVISLVLLSATLWFTLGSPYPILADSKVWLWLSLSGFVGYVFGDYCLFNSYLLIGSRFGQLFMTLAAPFAAIAAWILLGETMTWLGLLGMLLTITGIGMSILSRPSSKEGHSHKVSVGLPLKGILFGIGAGMGQGVGLVLSKVGLEHYRTLADASDSMMQFMIPFAGTMIRAITGLVCFVAIMAVQHQFGAMRQALHDGKGMHATFWASFTGPFVGVSLSLMAVQYANAGVAQCLMSLTPILILWPSHVFFGNKITIKEIIGAIIAVAGATLFFI